MQPNTSSGPIPILPIQLTACSPKTISGKLSGKCSYGSCYLNEPAGNVAKVVISYAVTQVVAAWSNETVDPRAAVESILQCFCHPALLTQSPLHQTMFATVKLWVDNIPVDKKARILEGLTSQGVRQGRHHDDEKRKAEQQIAVQQQAAFSTNFSTSGSASLSRSVNTGLVTQNVINPLVSQSRVIRDDHFLHGPQDYSHNYHLAQLYATSSFQAQTSYSTVTQRSEPYVSTYTQSTTVTSTPVVTTSTTVPSYSSLALQYRLLSPT